MPVMRKLPDDHPLMVAWNKYQDSEEFKSSKNWALQIAPLVQEGDPNAEHKHRFEIMPLHQRDQLVQGSLWAAFAAGYKAAGGKI